VGGCDGGGGDSNLDGWSGSNDHDDHNNYPDHSDDHNDNHNNDDDDYDDMACCATELALSPCVVIASLVAFSSSSSRLVSRRCCFAEPPSP
jgi:hypothetical protein